MDIVGLFIVLAAFVGVMTIQSRISQTDQRVAAKDAVERMV